MKSELSDFDLVYQSLEAKESNWSKNEKYLVPEILIGGTDPSRIVDVGNPYTFYSNIFREIKDFQLAETSIKSNGKGQNYLEADDVIYQSFIRAFTSLNNEIGSALKQVAFLPFLKRNFKISIIIFLPPSIIGKTNKKGERGSPFAVYDPFSIDDSLKDPLLPDVNAVIQYKALIQACKALGIRPGSIVPMTVLAIDNPLFRYFPDLGFWWIAKPGELLYSTSNNSQVEDVPGHTVIDISPSDRLRFVSAPLPNQVYETDWEDQIYTVANVTSDNSSTLISLANAFPDPIAGDSAMYTWSDVATVKYTNSDFPSPQGVPNDSEYDLSKPAWHAMPHTLAWRIRDLGEEVLLIDVNQMVPEDILKRACYLAEHWQGSYEHVKKLMTIPVTSESARDLLDYMRWSNEDLSDYYPNNVTFIGEELWEFDIKASLLKGIVGPLIFCVSPHEFDRHTFTSSLRYHLKTLENKKTPIKYFAGVSNHDTRPLDPDKLPLLWTIYFLLPHSMLMLFSGVEYGSQLITNKEFGFPLTERLGSLFHKLSDTDLALFNDITLNWNALSKSTYKKNQQVFETLISLKKHILRNYSNDMESYQYLALNSENCFGYQLHTDLGKVWVICNLEQDMYLQWTFEDCTLIFCTNEKMLKYVPIAHNQYISFITNSAYVFVANPLAEELFDE